MCSLLHSFLLCTVLQLLHNILQDTWRTYIVRWFKIDSDLGVSQSSTCNFTLPLAARWRHLKCSHSMSLTAILPEARFIVFLKHFLYSLWKRLLPREPGSSYLTLKMKINTVRVQKDFIKGDIWLKKTNFSCEPFHSQYATFHFNSFKFFLKRVFHT